MTQETKEIIENLVNAWYQTWINENVLLGKADECNCEAFTDKDSIFWQKDFKWQIENILPTLVLSQVNETDWIILKEL